MSDNQELNFTWRTLNEVLSTLPEHKVKALLDAEMTGAKRIKVIERLHQRYNILRATREREELLRFALKKVSPQGEETNPNTYSYKHIEKQESWLDIIANERNSFEISELADSVTPKFEIEIPHDDYQRTIEDHKKSEFTKPEQVFNENANAEIKIINNNLINSNKDKINSKEIENPIQIGINDLEKHNEEAIFDALNFFDKKCPYCGKDQYRIGVRDKIEIDHFMPIARGGQNVPWNLIPVCKECNRKKKATLPSLFLDTSTFNAVNNYLIAVKDKFSKIGIYQFSSFQVMENIIIKNREFIRKNISENFIIELINHLQIEDKKYISDDLDTNRELINDLVDMRGLFSIGVVFSPLDEFCKSIKKDYGILFSQKELKLILLNAGWIDAGRIASREHPVKKHIFHSPKLIKLSKSDLRRITENNGT